LYYTSIGHDGQSVTTNFGMIELVTTNFGMIAKKRRHLGQFGRSIGKNHEFNQDDLAYFVGVVCRHVVGSRACYRAAAKAQHCRHYG